MKNNKYCMIFAVTFLFLQISNIGYSLNKTGESFTGNTFPPSGWRTQHVSGLSSAGSWVRSTTGYHTGPACAESPGGLLADNFLITNRITPSSGDSLVFWVSSNYVLTALGRLDVKVSSTDSLAASFIDFLIPLQINLGVLTPNVYYRHAVSLNDYEGQQIYIAFRHIEVGGLFGAVRLDGIVIGGVDLNLTALIEAHSGVGWFPVPRRDRDSVKVSIRSSVSPFSILETKQAYLDTLGNKTFNFNIPVEEVNYYIFVEHRNAVRTWSRPGGEIFSSGSLSYDFTTGVNKAYGNNQTMVNGKAHFYSGDVIQNGYIDLSDVLLIYNEGLVFTIGPYVTTDLNWDQYTDLSDQIIAYNHSVLFVSEIFP